jgi:tetrahydromethanopterin S-methyltransferase subunit B
MTNRLVVIYLFAISLSATMVLPPAKAQAQDSSQSADELRQELNNLQEQMKKLQSRLDDLEANKASPSAAAPAATSPSQSGTVQPSQPPLHGQTSTQVGTQTATYETFAEDTTAAPRYDNVPLDPKYSGFFRLPGTQTILKIGGYFKTDFIYDLKPAGNGEAFVPSSIPIPQIVTINNTTVSIRPTRLSLDFRIPSTSIGEVRFYAEGDLFGTNATTPRLRHAYAQASNFLVGQTFTNFMDPDGFPDTLDFQGPNGLVNLRNPQIRYGVALGKSTTLYFAVEKPSSDVIFKTEEFTSQPNAPSPDGTVRLRQEFQGGHFQVAGIFRTIAAFVTSGANAKTDSVFGWGINISTGFKTFGKDNVVFGAAAGHGISRYIQDTSGLGIDAEVTSVPTNPHLTPTPDVGVDAAYQHYWKKTLRSNLVYSYAAVNNPPLSAFVPSDTYNHGEYTAANIIWNPFGSSLNMGAEFLYGWQVLQDGAKGNAPRIQFSAKYNFVKVNADKK